MASLRVGTDLRGANLRGAYLGEASFGGADLREANLSDTELTPEQLAAACGDETTELPEGFEMPAIWPCEPEDAAGSPETDAEPGRQD